ncbi:helix-turn-helix domain-containing protein [Streptomyces chattanoogensis]|uniref:AraC family transcriptional regulator n=1 Tax=Streptomyces chattanoogensis TaxID=66876 RepID=A0A0N0XZY4_9ACTN|nr:helix-turn-helix domain-containing protein [Streptomyces chattanoogensis]KPC65284.1 AraC family transcriptional regulator [Streptomyces chattanoogensis]
MLDEMVFRSEDVPASDRFDYWVDLLGRTHAPMELRSDCADDFQASQRVLDLGAVTVWSATFQPLVFRRTPELIRQSDPEAYHLSLIVRGAGVGVWRHRETEYKPNDLFINSSSLPNDVHSTSDPAQTVALEVPKALLPLPRDTAGRIVGAPVSARDGMGALLARVLTQLTADTTTFHPCDGPRLGAVLTDLVAALFAHILEAGPCLPPETHRRALALRIQAFIREHLHDPHLTPSSIAAEHHISTSYLHRLFRDEDTTVAAWIRRLRLEAARRDLTDPALHAIPIHAIATRWGFPRAADFSRTFRAAYGTTPRGHRHQSLYGHE